MNGMLDIVYSLSHLDAKARSTGLTEEEKAQQAAIEEELMTPEFGRRYKRIDLKISAVLSYDGEESLVRINDISPGGMRVSGCPRLRSGEVVEFRLREEEDRVFMFAAQVIWMSELMHDRIAGFRFVAAPVLIEGEDPMDTLTEDSARVA